MDTHVNFLNLRVLKEFYGRMGFESVRFRPGYFPYTEPSVERRYLSVTLAGLNLEEPGSFVKKSPPWASPVLSLHGGLASHVLPCLRMGHTDLRELYQSDIDWIRNTPVIHGGRCDAVVSLPYKYLGAFVVLTGRP